MTFWSGCEGRTSFPDSETCSFVPIAQPRRKSMHIMSIGTREGRLPPKVAFVAKNMLRLEVIDTGVGRRREQRNDHGGRNCNI
jgi:hypothetical protein